VLWTALGYLRPPPGSPAPSAGSPTPPQGGGEREGAAFALPPPTRGGRTAEASAKAVRVGGLTFLALVYLQILLGALVAGLHAGLIYNTWPSMDGRVFPEGAFSARPWWINFFENPGLAQFDHRLGAYIVAIAAIILWLSVRRARLAGRARLSADVILIATFAQIALGIVTLLNQAPILLSALHQTTALLLLSAALWHAFETRRGLTSSAY